MSKAYWQVMRSYLRRPFTSWTMGIFAFNSVMFLLFAVWDSSVNRLHILPLLAGPVFAGTLLWTHLREQVLHPRRRLMPGFAIPHLAAFMTFAIPLLLLPALALRDRHWSSAFAGFAISFFIFALLGIATLRESMGVSAVLGVVLACSFFESGQAVLASLLAAEHPVETVMMAVFAFFSVTIVLRSMFSIDEESKNYQTRGFTNAANYRPRSTGELNTPAAAAQAEHWLGRKFAGYREPMSGPGLWARVQRWRYFNGASMVIIPICIGVSTNLVFQNLIGGSPMDDLSRAMPFVLLVAMVPQVWLQRWKFVEMEVLRPVERSDYFKELGLAMAVDFGIAGTAIMAIVWSASAYWSPESVNPRSAVTSGLLFSAPLMITFAMSAWCLRYRSSGWLGLTAVTVWPLMILAGSAIRHLHPGLSLIVAASGGLIIVSLMISTYAHRCWMKTELG